MSRKKRHVARTILPDPKYGDVLIAQTVNIIMRHGKKGVVERALYAAIDEVAEKSKSDGREMLHKAISAIRPMVEVRSRRVGGATYQVPSEIRTERSYALAIRWLVTAADERPEKTLSARLAGEILDACSNRGIALKKREDTHRMAEANKAFAHFRW